MSAVQDDDGCAKPSKVVPDIELAAQMDQTLQRLDWLNQSSNMQSAVEGQHMYFRVGLQEQSDATYSGSSNLTPVPIQHPENGDCDEFYVKHWIRQASDQDVSRLPSKGIDLNHTAIAMNADYIVVRVQINREQVSEIGCKKSSSESDWGYFVSEIDAVVVASISIRITFLLERKVEKKKVAKLRITDGISVGATSVAGVSKAGQSPASLRKTEDDLLPLGEKKQHHSIPSDNGSINTKGVVLTSTSDNSTSMAQERTTAADLDVNKSSTDRRLSKSTSESQSTQHRHQKPPINQDPDAAFGESSQTKINTGNGETMRVKTALPSDVHNSATISGVCSDQARTQQAGDSPPKKGLPATAAHSDESKDVNRELSEVKHSNLRIGGAPSCNVKEFSHLQCSVAAGNQMKEAVGIDISVPKSESDLANRDLSPSCESTAAVTNLKDQQTCISQVGTMPTVERRQDQSSIHIATATSEPRTMTSVNRSGSTVFPMATRENKPDPAIPDKVSEPKTNSTTFTMTPVQATKLDHGHCSGLANPTEPDRATLRCDSIECNVNTPVNSANQSAGGLSSPQNDQRTTAFSAAINPKANSPSHDNPTNQSSYGALTGSSILSSAAGGTHIHHMPQSDKVLLNNVTHAPQDTQRMSQMPGVISSSYLGLADNPGVARNASFNQSVPPLKEVSSAVALSSSVSHPPAAQSPSFLSVTTKLQPPPSASISNAAAPNHFVAEQSYSHLSLHHSASSDKHQNVVMRDSSTVASKSHASAAKPPTGAHKPSAHAKGSPSGNTQSPTEIQVRPPAHPCLMMWVGRSPTDPYEPFFIADDDENYQNRVNRNYLVSCHGGDASRYDYNRIGRLPYTSFPDSFSVGPDLDSISDREDDCVVVYPAKRARKEGSSRSTAGLNDKEHDDGSVEVEVDYISSVKAVAAYNDALYNERCRMHQWYIDDMRLEKEGRLKPSQDDDEDSSSSA